MPQARQTMAHEILMAFFAHQFRACKFKQMFAGGFGMVMEIFSHFYFTQAGHTFQEL